MLGISSADLENPLINIHTRNIENLKEKAKEIKRLYTILETSEYVVQAYNNIDTFSKQVLDRLDYVLPMDGSFFYMFDQNAERVERLILSSLFIKIFTEEDAKLLLAYVRDSIEKSSRTGSTFSIVLIDIDDFKLINDVYGPHTADMVLKELSERLKRNLGKMDIPARFGGDEFAVLLPDLPKDTARAVAKRLINILSSKPVKIENKEIPISVSAVVVSYPQDGTSEQELIT
jgi:diguanylate cyclase (GGDEF)-like protein